MEIPKQETEITQHNNMQRWGSAIGRLARKLDNADLRNITKETSVTKVDCAKEFEALNLPGYVRTIESLSTFLANGEPNTAGMKTDRFWFQLIPSTPNGNKITVLDKTREDIYPQVQTIIRDNGISPQEYSLLVSEFLENRYGGQMVISKAGEVSLYFGAGAEIDYSSGSKIPEYSADNKNSAGIFHYSFEDSDLRKAAQKLVQAVAISDVNSFRPNYHPGYYEFALCGDNDQSLWPIFLDYMPSDFYQLSER